MTRVTNSLASCSDFYCGQQKLRQRQQLQLHSGPKQVGTRVQVQHDVGDCGQDGGDADDYGDSSGLRGATVKQTSRMLSRRKCRPLWVQFNKLAKQSLHLSTKTLANAVIFSAPW